MKITDACVCPYPLGDSSVRRLALEAGELGFDSIVAIDAPSGEYAGVEIIGGTLLRDRTAREVINQVKRARDKGRVISVLAGDNGFNRAVIGIKGLHCLTGIHTADKKAFDHVTAKMAADNGVVLDLDLSPIISGRGIGRQRAIHRYRDILMFAGRFGFPVTLSSHARSILEMRSVREITGLCSLVGMDEPDVEAALDSIGRVTDPRNVAVKVIR
ncbi:MAG: Ribonuclease P protein component 3 [Methanoregula sp. SKADARSKE-2]|nr:MAG: Ribonuclease P protein component 3 [Methanoregula sp. SKADARSKE-2]